MTLRIRRAAAAAFALLAFARPAGAAVLGFDRPSDAFDPSPGFRLDAGHPEDPPAGAPSRPAPETPPKPAPPFWDAKTTALTAGVVVGVPLLGYFAWWKNSSRSSFTVANERWFQEDTYAGGADKASHIFWGYLGSQLLSNAYQSLGKTPAQARGLTLAVVTVTGALIEIGDAYSQYGFAWEDIAANTIGALVAFGIDAWRIDDTVGLRFGLMSTPIPDACCRYGGYGDDYSKEIYTLDLKLAGLFPRMGAKPGLARFLLLSGTYQTKGYRYSPPENRRREIGIEIGLNVREVLVAVGVPEDKTWGEDPPRIREVLPDPLHGLGLALRPQQQHVDRAELRPRLRPRHHHLRLTFSRRAAPRATPRSGRETTSSRRAPLGTRARRATAIP